MEVVKSILRILQLLFVLLVTALIGNVIASNISGAESAINFSMFVCALAWLAVLYGIVSHFVSAASIPIVALALDSAATLFTFIDSIVLSAKLQAVNCNNFGRKASDYIAFGSNDDEKRCREIQASIVFMWFLFAAFAASLFFILNDFRRSGGSVRGPNMSQIGV
ncbi:marvel domain-containing protein [Hypoxylon rubiginosum]|uniref:Marvel domain-containing protein n=1 Tax=Hypoxylon rubiginosum TaxID=110542 RepID=A0ACC0DBS4_9PEZI|nr:marvel domain-containing protein [Hypoxylon rubiginosum]